MQDYINDTRGNGKYFMPTGHQYDFQVMENPATPLAQNINLNISHIIEDVKKQRLDIIKLNNELKNSRNFLDRRNLEELKSRQELSVLVNTLRKEKEQLMTEARGYRDSRDRLEGKLSEKDGLISELRAKNADCLKQLADRQKEADDLKYSYTRIKAKFEDEQTNSRQSFENKEALASAEGKAQQYFEKFKTETQKTTKLQKELTSLQESYNALTEEKDKVALKLNQYIESNSKLKKEVNVLKIDSSAGNRNIEELQEDLRLFTELHDQMDDLILEVQKTEEWEQGDEEAEMYDDDEN